MTSREDALFGDDTQSRVIVPLWAARLLDGILAPSEAWSAGRCCSQQSTIICLQHVCRIHTLLRHEIVEFTVITCPLYHTSGRRINNRGVMYIKIFCCYWLNNKTPQVHPLSKVVKNCVNIHLYYESCTPFRA